MYHRDDKNQLGIEEFFMPFGGRLSRESRWVKMAEIMPWPLIETVEDYLRKFGCCPEAVLADRTYRTRENTIYKYMLTRFEKRRIQ
ncbi:MAG: hypothetical protein II881_07420 [Oscillospiraceae bacterium]|nr:hypothetical protein [Oscillospiraceae bacterium]